MEVTRYLRSMCFYSWVEKTAPRKPGSVRRPFEERSLQFSLWRDKNLSFLLAQ
jgi:hypothetical protein